MISIPLWDDCKPVTMTKKVAISQFQFHYGMIVRTVTHQMLIMESLFQFHYGMIVRKKKCKPLQNLKAFQFHYGMIVSLPDAVKYGFLYNISIPLWDDCKFKNARYSTSDDRISIPLWDDCKSYTKIPSYPDSHFNSTMG